MIFFATVPEGPEFPTCSKYVKVEPGLSDLCHVAFDEDRSDCKQVSEISEPLASLESQSLLSGNHNLVIPFFHSVP